MATTPITRTHSTHESATDWSKSWGKNNNNEQQNEQSNAQQDPQHDNTLPSDGEVEPNKATEPPDILEQGKVPYAILSIIEEQGKPLLIDQQVKAEPRAISAPVHQSTRISNHPCHFPDPMQDQVPQLDTTNWDTALFKVHSPRQPYSVRIVHPANCIDWSEPSSPGSTADYFDNVFHHQANNYLGIVDD